MFKMFHSPVSTLVFILLYIGTNTPQAASIQGMCRVRNKDIRKFLDGIYVSDKGTIVQE